jgi:hypothetical protein
VSVVKLSRLSVLLPALSCAGNTERGIVPDLVAHEPVCLALDWSTRSRADIYDGMAPDTLLLQPGRRERFVDEDRLDAWGDIELAPSQQRLERGGWRWWVRSDTLIMRVDDPTMDGLMIWAVAPRASSRAKWREFGMRTAEGPVVLRRYQCAGPVQRSEP